MLERQNVNYLVVDLNDCDSHVEEDVYHSARAFYSIEEVIEIYGEEKLLDESVIVFEIDGPVAFSKKLTYNTES